MADEPSTSKEQPFRSRPLTRASSMSDDTALQRRPRRATTPPSRQPPVRQNNRQPLQEPIDNAMIQQLYLENKTLRRRLLERKTFSPSNINESMSYKYLHIDTSHLGRNPNENLYNIDLLEPIRNCSHMELTAFTVANDFYNVIEENNTVRMIFKRSPDTGTTALNDLYVIEVSLEPGFYTHADLIAEITAQIILPANGYSATAIDTDGFYTVYPSVLAVGTSSFASQTTYPVRIKLTQETSGKTTIEFKQPSTIVANGLTYAMISFPFEDFEQYFNDSIYHRLGYTKQQVYFTDKYLTDPTSVFISNSTSTNRIVLTNQSLILLDVQGGQDVAISSQLITGYTRNFSNSSFQKMTSNKLAWETHSSLQLTCDLIHDTQQTTRNYSVLKRTEFSDVLAEVKIDVNRSSWIHYIPQTYTHVHKVDSPIIKNFKIGIRNSHNHRHFQSDEHRDFQITLKLHLMDDESIPNREMFNSFANGMRFSAYE